MTTIAFAGRLIDPADAVRVRFPLAAVPAVSERIRTYFRECTATMLVASAACGADLIALRVAEEANIPRRIVLPFDAATFLASSVTSRPGDWEPDYRKLVATAEAEGLLINLGMPSDDSAAYDAATERILDEAEQFGETVRVCIVSEGASRGPGDHSMKMAKDGAARGWPVDHISTVLKT